MSLASVLLLLLVTIVLVLDAALARTARKILVLESAASIS
jgi:hypothetical protein